MPHRSLAALEPDHHRLTRLMRRPQDLMSPATLAAIQPSRISCSRAMVNQAARERWQFTCKSFQIDQTGLGRALYEVEVNGWLFSFPVFSYAPKKEGRTGRIIGRTWDMLGALVEGPMSQTEIEDLAHELPKLYEGRASKRTLIWCRSNRSGRFFDAALSALAAGQQPDVADLATTCYLMRNTGLDGNGTFGTKTFLAYEADHPLRWSLGTQMLCAYMMRVFAQDLLAHLARLQSPQAVAMAPELARFLGVGNGSALGLMLFVNNHPRLIDRWIWTREEALARAKMLPADAAKTELLLTLLDKALRFRAEDRAEYENIIGSDVIAAELATVRARTAALLDAQRKGQDTGAEPLAALCDGLAGSVQPETLETLHSLLIELVPEVADALVQGLVIDEELTGRPEMSAGRLRDMVRGQYPWAFGMDLNLAAEDRFVWYKSMTAEEPRRGPVVEVGEDVVNLGLDLPRLLLALERDLATAEPGESVARFLLRHPQHRAIATRVQALDGLSFHSPEADIMSRAFTPAHIARLMNVGLHGIDKTRDFLDRNLRGVLFHGAPLASDIASGAVDPFWFYPAEPKL